MFRSKKILLSLIAVILVTAFVVNLFQNQAVDDQLEQSAEVETKASFTFVNSLPNKKILVKAIEQPSGKSSEVVWEKGESYDVVPPISFPLKLELTVLNPFESERLKTNAWVWEGGVEEVLLEFEEADELSVSGCVTWSDSKPYSGSIEVKDLKSGIIKFIKANSEGDFNFNIFEQRPLELKIRTKSNVHELSVEDDLAKKINWKLNKKQNDALSVITLRNGDVLSEFFVNDKKYTESIPLSELPNRFRVHALGHEGKWVSKKQLLESGESQIALKPKLNGIELRVEEAKTLPAKLFKSPKTALLDLDSVLDQPYASSYSIDSKGLVDGLDDCEPGDLFWCHQQGVKRWFVVVSREGQLILEAHDEKLSLKLVDAFVFGEAEVKLDLQKIQLKFKLSKSSRDLFLPNLSGQYSLNARSHFGEVMESGEWSKSHQERFVHLPQMNLGKLKLGVVPSKNPDRSVTHRISGEFKGGRFIANLVKLGDDIFEWNSLLPFDVTLIDGKGKSQELKLYQESGDQILVSREPLYSLLGQISGWGKSKWTVQSLNRQFTREINLNDDKELKLFLPKGLYKSTIFNQEITMVKDFQLDEKLTLPMDFPDMKKVKTLKVSKGKLDLDMQGEVLQMVGGSKIISDLNFKNSDTASCSILNHQATVCLEVQSKLMKWKTEEVLEFQEDIQKEVAYTVPDGKMVLEFEEPFIGVLMLKHQDQKYKVEINIPSAHESIELPFLLKGRYQYQIISNIENYKGAKGRFLYNNNKEIHKI